MDDLLGVVALARGLSSSVGPGLLLLSTQGNRVKGLWVQEMIFYISGRAGLGKVSCHRLS